MATIPVSVEENSEQQKTAPTASSSALFWPTRRPSSAPACAKSSRSKMTFG